MLDLREVFESYKKDLYFFSRVKNKAHPNPQICAFLLLDDLCPNSCIFSSSNEDRVYFSFDMELFSELSLKAHVLTLVRCGVQYDIEKNQLYMETNS